jgi:hypothetical protein
MDTLRSTRPRRYGGSVGRQLPLNASGGIQLGGTDAYSELVEML